MPLFQWNCRLNISDQNPIFIFSFEEVSHSMDVFKLDFIVSRVMLRFNLCYNQNPINKLPTFSAILTAVNRYQWYFINTDKAQNIAADEYIGASEPPKYDIRYFKRFCDFGNYFEPIPPRADLCETFRLNRVRKPLSMNAGLTQRDEFGIHAVNGCLVCGCWWRRLGAEERPFVIFSINLYGNRFPVCFLLVMCSEWFFFSSEETLSWQQGIHFI